MNACTVVDDEVTDPLNPQDDLLVNTLLIGDLTFDGCTIGDVYSISFGIRVVDGAPPLEEMVETLGGDPPEDVPDLGDEAFRSESDFGSIVTGVRYRGYEVIVRNESLGNTNPEVHVSDETVNEFLKTYIEEIPVTFRDQALNTEVTDGCPAADDPAVTAVAGPVQLARGGSVRGSVRCTYLGEDLSTLQLSRASAENAEELIVPQGDPATEVTIDGATFAEQSVFSSTRSEEVSLDILVSETEYSHVTARTDGRSLDPTAVVTLAELFLADSQTS